MPHAPHTPPARSPAKADTLIGARPGSAVRIDGFTAATPADLRERLLAYGLIPGQTLRVLAQKPLTMLQIEHTELALERELAACVAIAAGG
jgi:Fe2+ transport system protein FeoA